MPSPRLENERANNAERCANCGWWQGKAGSAGPCDRHGIKTLDLAKCTDWRDGDPLVDILAPETNEE